MKIDLHIHSIASGHALNTVSEIISYAEKCNMTHIAITDHGPSMIGAPQEGYFEVSDMMYSKVGNMNIYMGAEANILDLDGTIDICEPYFSMQKIISAGIHEKTPYIRKRLLEHTEAILSVIEKKNCHIITHPWREQFPVDIEVIVKSALEHKILLELNDRIFRKTSAELIRAYRKMIELIKKGGGYVIIGSDSHIRENIGNDQHIMKLKEEIGLIPEIIINNYPSVLEEILNEK